MNRSCEKLEVIRHGDYIPEKYLPTFNSNVIEMNYFRIRDLSENYVLLNDDLFPIRPIPETYYFQDNLPCEEAVETHFILKSDKGLDSLDLQMNYACVNNMVLLNRHFDKGKVVRRNHEKWFHPVYGRRLNQNINMQFWNNFESFVYPHEAMPMKKSVLRDIWEKEPQALDMASQNRFRSYSDITQRLVTMWQICSGEFVPHRYEGKLFLLGKNNCGKAAEAIRRQEYPIVSLNETRAEDFDQIREIRAALEEILPEKSGFE